MRPFLPTPRQTNLLLLLGFVTLGAALYVRHSILESEPIAAACLAGATRPACGLRRFLIELSELEFFSGVALLVAAFHLWRPDTRLFASALVASILGLFFGNVAASAFAATVLIIAFGRPAHASKRGPGRQAPPPAKAPANSRTTR